MLKTRITEMLGIKYPIICGGMMRINYPRFLRCHFQCRGAGEPYQHDVREQGRAEGGDPRGQGAYGQTLYRHGDHPAPRKRSDSASTRTISMPAPRRGCLPWRSAACRSTGSTTADMQSILKDAGIKLFHKVGSVKHGKKRRQDRI